MLPRHAPRSYWIILTLSSCAVTSLGINSIAMRDNQKAERIKLTTQRSVLRELIQRYRNGEQIPENEEYRLLRLASIQRKKEEEEEKTTVMEAIFGRKVPPADEEKEMQQLRQIWEDVLRDDDQQKNTLS